MVQLYSEEDLLSRLAFSLQDEEARPVAFLTGAGLSAPMVPGVSTIMNSIRNVFPAEEQIKLDSVLSNHSDAGQKYRVAFEFLEGRRPPKVAQRVVRAATLHAFDSEGRDASFLMQHAETLEDEIDSWKVPKGQLALGRLLSGLPLRLRGPVFTTNFDPLTEIAIRRAGGTANTLVHVDNSSFISNMRVQTGTSVVHLHGLWRDSSVLNTSEQLEVARPAVTAALRMVLARHTLVVIGYGGWSDIVTSALLSVLAEQREEDLDVLWCIYADKDVLEKSPEHAPALAAFGTAPGNIKFYAGIDANHTIPQLEKRVEKLLNYSQARRSASVGSTLPGWTTITRDALTELRSDASPAAALTFFDGRLPTWHDAVNTHIPTRELAVAIEQGILNDGRTRQSSLTVVTGPSGEGKSMIALQVAAQMANHGDNDYRVFALAGDYFGSVEAITSLSKGSSYLLLVDEAHKFVSQLQDLVEALRVSGRTGIHLLIVSGDTDWQACGGANYAWQRSISTASHQVQGLSHIDASTMIAAWEDLGPRALGDLNRYPTSAERVEALLDFSFSEGVAGRGTLLGALLTTRYDRPGLREHVRQLLEKLRTRLIPTDRNTTLMDALVAIALPHAYGCIQLNATVLASVIGITKAELEAYVLYPLGEESAITYGSGRIVARHELIASTIIDVCLEIGYDLEKVAAKVVAAAASEILSGRYSDGIIELAYLSSRINDIPKLALASARSAVAAAPGRLSYRTSLSAAYRKSFAPSEAAKCNEESLPLLVDPENRNQLRGFFTEWGVTEGILGNFARNAVLAGLALQDGTALGALSVKSAGRALSCMLLAFRRVCETQPHREALAALAAASVVFREIQTGQELAWLRAAERVVDANGHPFPRATDAATIQRDLAVGLKWAAAHVEAPFPTTVPAVSPSFGDLVRLMTR